MTLSCQLLTFCIVRIAAFLHSSSTVSFDPPRKRSDMRFRRIVLFSAWMSMKGLTSGHLVLQAAITGFQYAMNEARKPSDDSPSSRKPFASWIDLARMLLTCRLAA